MWTAVLSHELALEEFASHAARLLADDVSPEDVLWQVGHEETDLFSTHGTPKSGHGKSVDVRPFRTLLMHRNRSKFGLAYRLLFRLRRTPDLLKMLTDPDVHAFYRMEREVRRDIHKMRAFLRFREVQDQQGEPFYIAWFEPDHLIVEANMDFFIGRFANMKFAIITPDCSVHYDGKIYSLAHGGHRSDVPEADAVSDLWKKYYQSIFNPNRIKIKAMLKEMPKRYWKNMPETDLISPLLQQASRRSQAMIAASPTPPKAVSPVVYVQPQTEIHTLSDLSTQIQGCARCPLFRNATQAVCGTGPQHAAIMVLAEQPGDHEDITGVPLVGPAGQVFDAALERSGLKRDSLYITNTVKHFKFQPTGRRRIHQRPSPSEVEHCRWWLNKEIALVKPKVVLAMGATAMRGLTGQSVSIADMRGQFMPLNHTITVMPTFHPAYLLRLTDADQKREAWAKFLQDVRAVRDAAYS